jgi:hypothetical protein
MSVQVEEPAAGSAVVVASGAEAVEEEKKEEAPEEKEVGLRPTAEPFTRECENDKHCLFVDLN